MFLAPTNSPVPPLSHHHSSPLLCQVPHPHPPRGVLWRHEWLPWGEELRRGGPGGHVRRVLLCRGRARCLWCSVSNLLFTAQRCHPVSSLSNVPNVQCSVEGTDLLLCSPLKSCLADLPQQTTDASHCLGSTADPGLSLCVTHLLPCHSCMLRGMESTARWNQQHLHQSHFPFGKFACAASYGQSSRGG